MVDKLVMKWDLARCKTNEHNKRSSAVGLGRGDVPRCLGNFLKQILYLRFLSLRYLFSAFIVFDCA